MIEWELTPIFTPAKDFKKVEKQPELKKLEDGVYMDEESESLYEVSGGKIIPLVKSADGKYTR